MPGHVKLLKRYVSNKKREQCAPVSPLYRSTTRNLPFYIFFSEMWPCQMPGIFSRLCPLYICLPFQKCLSSSQLKQKRFHLGHGNYPDGNYPTAMNDYLIICGYFNIDLSEDYSSDYTYLLLHLTSKMSSNNLTE